MSTTLCETGVYTVHAVENGERLILSVQNQWPLVLHLVALTGVVCPRIARYAGQEFIPDEAYSFEAREYTRKRLIGKSIKFISDGKLDAINRTVGRVALQDGEDIGLALASQGLGSVQEKQGKGPREYMEKLIMANETAKHLHLGIYAGDGALHVRDLQPSPPEDTASLFAAFKGEAQKVLVERVQSGSGLIVTILAYNQQCLLNFFGINCPSLREAATEALAAEAKSHTERCLLHREVMVEFNSITPHGAFHGSIISGKNIFQEDLIQRGYARVLVSTLATSSYREQFLAAEKTAQERKVGIWKDYTPPQVLNDANDATAKNTKPSGPEYLGDRSFNATVLQIVSGDTLLLSRAGDKKENVKVTLASVRANRAISRDQDGKDSRVRYENWTWECKEALRKLCIGKEVHVTVDYVRTIEETKETRPYVTLTVTDRNENVGVHLVSLGLAKAMCNGSEVASCVDELRDAETVAKQKKIGIHSGKEPAPTRMVELSRITEKKARQYLSYFQRGSQGGRPPRLNAIVEMVLGPASIRIFIAKENTIITLKLAGIAAPQGAQGDQEADAFAVEAKQFVLQMIQNRDVFVEVETVDKFGNFIGTLFYQNTNVAIALTQAGFAAVANADRLTYAVELRKAEKAAQEAKLFIWKDPKYLPARIVRAQERDNRAAPGSVVVSRTTDALSSILITEVLSSTMFYMCTLDEPTKAKRRSIEQELSAFTDEDGSNHRYTPKKDERVVARFSLDGTWYRASVVDIQPDKKSFTVRYIDFGNSEVRTSEDIRSCQHFSSLIRDTQPLATEGRMAFLRDALPNDFADLATDALRTYLDVPSLYGRLEYSCGANKYYTITNSSLNTTTTTEDSAAMHLVKTGMGIVDAKVQTALDHKEIQSILSALSLAQAAAQKSGANVWRYGTAIADEDEEVI